MMNINKNKFEQERYGCRLTMKKAVSRGFTLIELLVVISIIALLMSIMMPALGRAKELARRSICANNLKSLGQGVFVYASSNKDTLPVPGYQTGAVPWYSYLLFDLYLPDMATATPKGRVLKTYGLGRLFMDDIIQEGKVYYCPSAPKGIPGGGVTGVSYRYQEYSNNGQTFPWNNDESGHGPERVRSSFNYTPQAKNTSKAVSSSNGSGNFPEMAKKTSQLYEGYIMANDVLWDTDHLSHKKGNGKRAAGVNALFSDGSVDFRNNPDAFSSRLWPDSVVINTDRYLFRKIIQDLE